MEPIVKEILCLDLPVEQINDIEIDMAISMLHLIFLKVEQQPSDYKLNSYSNTDKEFKKLLQVRGAEKLLKLGNFKISKKTTEIPKDKLVMSEILIIRAILYLQLQDNEKILYPYPENLVPETNKKVEKLEKVEEIETTEKKEEKVEKVESEIKSTIEKEIVSTDQKETVSTYEKETVPTDQKEILDTKLDKLEKIETTDKKEEKIESEIKSTIEKEIVTTDQKEIIDTKSEKLEKMDEKEILTINPENLEKIDKEIDQIKLENEITHKIETEIINPPEKETIIIEEKEILNSKSKIENLDEKEIVKTILENPEKDIEKKEEMIQSPSKTETNFKEMNENDLKILNLFQDCFDHLDLDQFKTESPFLQSIINETRNIKSKLKEINIPIKNIKRSLEIIDDDPTKRLYTKKEESLVNEMKSFFIKIARELGDSKCKEIIQNFISILNNQNLKSIDQEFVKIIGKKGFQFFRIQEKNNNFMIPKGAFSERELKIIVFEMYQLINHTKWIEKMKDSKVKETPKTSFKDLFTQRIIQIYQKDPNSKFINLLLKILKNYQNDKSKNNLKKEKFNNDELDLFQFLDFKMDEKNIKLNEEILNDYKLKSMILILEDLEKNIKNILSEELKIVSIQKEKVDEKKMEILAPIVKSKEDELDLKEMKVELKVELDENSFENKIIEYVKMIQVNVKNWSKILKILLLIFDNFEFKDSISRSFSLSSTFAQHISYIEVFKFLEFIGYKKDRNFMKFANDISLKDIIILRTTLESFLKNESPVLDSSILTSVSFKKSKSSFSFSFFDELQ